MAGGRDALYGWHPDMFCFPTGLHSKAQTVARGSSQKTEEKYENIGIKRQQTDPKLQPKLEPKDEAQDNSGVLYASLSLSSSSSPVPPPCIPPQKETLYSLIKA
ncbi:paired immunoglobulin-like type 2 receptor alpha [Ailuropoda melanoleuca]|uniref:paired immunoglobulin-like type 2 receptor alpha n=1 Tax=Ailuropoda melanoleuca TaxID=9646 RepID=UPI001494A00E|nr:paired immunoglobulin-like type 2 receptor alpha [Ailuropoda melanoleuca]